ncbi:MAG: S-adenosylmethionine tRNA ribosyltransferase [Bacteroidia bacterium]|nr:MAG: S-adenosylmethionine tRNA ribosyltransferase [Bacteroidia bacterium]
MVHHAPRSLRIADYSYDLPPARIAQAPIDPPERARLLRHDPTGIHDHIFGDLPTLLTPGTQLVVNDTKVIHARMQFHKPTGGRMEIFLLEPLAPANYVEAFQAVGAAQWRCLVGNSKRWRGEPLSLTLASGARLQARRDPDDPQRIHFSWEGPADFATLLIEAGSIPIPPYLRREAEARDNRWYQTLFANTEGSVAAPTAGLHFSQDLMARLASRGVSTARTTLHVGAGTFLPVKSETIGGHPMHTERMVITRHLLEELIAHRGPRVAVGTTSLRTLESLYYIGLQLALRGPSHDDGQCLHVPQWLPYEGLPELPYPEALGAILRELDRRATDQTEASTALLIAPGYRFRSISGLITNFHQPRSTLLLLVAALVGPAWRDIYAHALDEGYRFLSYGDGMLLDAPEG